MGWGVKEIQKQIHFYWVAKDVASMEMMFLVDTNIWLERLLEQEKSEEVKTFLDVVPSVYLSISDFAYHSVGVILNERGFANFISESEKAGQ